MSQPISQLRQDNDGHWYLVPEDRLVEFEDALALFIDDPEDDSFQDFAQYSVEDPSNLRVFSWQEL